MRVDHLSELALEQQLLQSTAERSQHLESCARCAARLQAMREESEQFRRFVFPATQDRVAAATRSKSRFGWIAAGLAFAVLVTVLAVPRGPSADYVGVKGAQLQLSVYREAEGVGALVHDGEAIPAASQLRFRVRTVGDPCRIWILSVDSGGAVSRLFPAEGEEGGLVASGDALPGGVALDGHPGPERLFAVCSRRPLSFKELERAAKDSIAQGEAPVREARELPGLDNALQTTVLVEKTP
ncbi:MAG: hypothetical protein ACT4TC_00565 [Myxococcaceae bacterium]